MLRFDADAVVLDGEEPLVALIESGDVDARDFLAMELDGVGEEVLEDKDELRRIGADGRKVIVGDDGLVLFEQEVQVASRLAQNDVRVGGCGRLAPCAGARLGQEIIKERLHANGAIDRVVDKLFGFVIELVLVALRQQLRVAGNHPERLL